MTKTNSFKIFSYNQVTVLTVGTFELVLNKKLSQRRNISEIEFFLIFACILWVLDLYKYIRIRIWIQEPK